MLIAVTNMKNDSGKSTCAVNLACELAGMETPPSDRWQGKNTVLLSMLAPKALHYCSSGRLPVSCEHLPLDDSNHDTWVQRIREIASQVDYVVVDTEPSLPGVILAIVGIADLVILPCSASPALDLEATVAMLRMVRAARSSRGDGSPKCLLLPTRVNAGTKAGEAVDEVLRASGEPVGPFMHQSVLFGEAFKAGLWIGAFAPDSAANGDIKALAERVKQFG
jgi:cellulose biosynthesis protein BcsQ